MVVSALLPHTTKAWGSVRVCRRLCKFARSTCVCVGFLHRHISKLISGPWPNALVKIWIWSWVLQRGTRGQILQHMFVWPIKCITFKLNQVWGASCSILATCWVYMAKKNWLASPETIIKTGHISRAAPFFRGEDRSFSIPWGFNPPVLSVLSESFRIRKCWGFTVKSFLQIHHLSCPVLRRI